jgi:CubicO group peptidase (beta-lactamase class C family)
MHRCVLAVLVAAAAAPAVAAEPFDPKPVDALIQKALAAWRVPGAAVAIVLDDEVVYLKGHGVREVGGRDPVTPNTVFPLASCSKAFTTTAMAILVDEGKMAWDDPVRKHVPFFRLSDPLADNAVTLRDLLCHRTGLRGHDLFWYRSTWSPEEAVRRAGLLPLDRPFRTAFQYQSTMFTAAGLAVSAAAERPWHEFVKERLLDPLGMSATVFTSTDAEKSADRAAGHRVNELGNVVTLPTAPMTTPDAAWTVHSTARDLAQWVRFHLGDGRVGGKRLLSRRNLEETHTPQMAVPLLGVERETHPETLQVSYAMAWVVQDYRGEKLVSHAGALDGIRAHLTLVPRRRLGVVVLANMQGTRMNLALSNAIVDHLLSAPQTDWNRLYLGLRDREAEKAAERAKAWRAQQVRGTTPSHALSEYAGRYEHPAYGTAEVRIDKGVPVWRWQSFSGPLEHFHYETFILHDPTLPDTPVLFKPGPTGEVGSMHVQGLFDVEFRKVKPLR